MGYLGFLGDSTLIRIGVHHAIDSEILLDDLGFFETGFSQYEVYGLANTKLWVERLFEGHGGRSRQQGRNDLGKTQIEVTPLNASKRNAKIGYLLRGAECEKRLFFYPCLFRWLPVLWVANGKLVRQLALGHQMAGFYESRSRAAYWDGRKRCRGNLSQAVCISTRSRQAISQPHEKC